MNGSGLRRVLWQASLLATLHAAQGLAVPLVAQTAASQTLSGYGLEAYFGDSLQQGAQRVITTQGATTRITASSAIPRDVILPTRVASAAVVGQPTAIGESRVILPDRAFIETSNGTGMLLVPVVIIEGRGMRYQNGAFRGSIRVGLEDSLRIGSSVPLPTPIRFFVSGTADSIQRPDTVVEHTNLPFSAINLIQATRAPVLSLNVRTTLHPDGVDVDVPVVVDSLRIDATPRVQGMGLEEARVVLGPAPLAAGAVIQLRADNLGLADNQVQLDGNGTATTTVRSYWFGPSTITARSIPFSDTEITVLFAFPWLFLGASLLGGALGALAAWLRTREDGERWLRRVGAGALLGLIATVLYAIGVNVTPINPAVSTGQALVFGLAAVIGYTGSLKLPAAGSTSSPAPS